MVRGRLKRESNPVPGEIPGFTPQHDSTGNGDFVDTSPINPMPTKDSSLAAKLDQLKAIAEGNKVVFPDVQDVNVKNQKAVQTVDGTVDIGNLPETQKVDGTVNVGNQPTDYPDGAALTELQSIKADIASTKQTQAEILSRLDGTFNTQLTGSKTVLKGDPFPDGKQNNTLLEYDTASGETSIYKYISGDWRKL